VFLSGYLLSVFIVGSFEKTGEIVKYLPCCESYGGVAGVLRTIDHLWRFLRFWILFRRSLVQRAVWERTAGAVLAVR
jgi:hypothetical protein